MVSRGGFLAFFLQPAGWQGLSGPQRRFFGHAPRWGSCFLLPKLGCMPLGPSYEIRAGSAAYEKVTDIFEAATIKPAVVHVESHPYLPEWDLLDYCRKNGIVLQAFAPLGHSSEPSLLADPIITAIANRVGKTPAQVALAWAIQRGTALLTTTKTPSRLAENFDVSTLPEDAMREINEGIKTRMRFNAVVETGVPGFIPRGK